MSRVHIIGEQKGKDAVTDFNEIIRAEDDARSVANIEMWTSRKVGEALIAEYPGYHWQVITDAPGKMLCIVCPDVSVVNGYHIAMKNLTIEGMIRRAKRAAGEVLERHGLPRTKLRDRSILDGLETDVRGSVITPDSAGESPIKAVH